MKYLKHCKSLLLFGILTGVLSCITPSVASELPTFTPLTLSLSHTAIKPGDTATAYLELTLPKGWHTYGKNPGDAGQPLKLSWQVPSGITPQDIQWQPTITFKTGPLTSYGYKDHVLFTVPLSVSKTLKPGQYPITVQAFYLVCNDTCIPKKETLFATLEVGPKSIPAKSLPPAYLDTKSNEHMSFMTSLKWILFSFIGGLILNIMPCVFPILSLKAISLLNTSATPVQRIREGWAYTFGVIISMASLGITVLVVQKLGAEIGWGFHLQSPIVVTLLAWLMLLLGLYFSGWFSVPEWLAQSASVIAMQGHKFSGASTLFSQFVTGVLAVFVAAPCTAPFMATTLGVALLHPGILSVEIFISLGLGLASPYLILCYSPSLQRLLPRPGRWMKTVEKILAIPLFITALWLATIAFKLVTLTGFTFVWIGMVSIFGLTRLNRFFNQDTPQSKRIVRLLVLAGLLGLLFKIHQEKQVSTLMFSVPSYALPYSQDVLEQAKRSHKTILLDVTASWCITCEVNRKTVLESSEIQTVIQEKNIQVLVADWTHYNPTITKLLSRYSRSGIPLVVVIYPSGKEIILPQVLTINTVKNALEAPDAK